MKIFSLINIFLLLSNTFVSQTKFLNISPSSESEQSLISNNKIKFENAKNDSIKVLAVFDIVDNSWDINVWPKYNEFIKTFISEKLNNKSLNKKEIYFYKSKFADCINNIGYYYGEIGNIRKQKEYYDSCLILRNNINDYVGLANSYNNLGYFHEKQANLPLAINFYLKSLKIKEKIGDSLGIISTLINLGFVNEQLKDDKSAFIYFSKSLKMALLINDQIGTASSLNHLGSYYQRIAQNEKSQVLKITYSDKALSNYKRALKINTSLNDKIGIAESYSNLGSLYQLKADYNQALLFYLKANEIQDKIQDKKGLTRSYDHIGTIYFIKNDLKEAELNALKSIKIAYEIGYPEEIASSSELLYKIYKIKSQKDKALKYYEIFIKMKDSVNNEKNIRENTQLLMSYDFDKQQALDSIQNLEKQNLKDAKINEQKAVLAQKKTLNIALIAGLSLLFVFSFSLFKKFKESKRQNGIISAQKLQVEEKNKLIDEKNKIVEEQNRDITDSIKYAERIQGAILPPEQKWNQILPGSFVLNKPKDILSGDFYWIADTEKHIFVAAADCTGHGVPGALISIVNYNLLNKAVHERGIFLPNEILDATNLWLTESLHQSIEESAIRDGMDVSLISINKENGQVLYSGANNPLYLFSNNELQEYKSDKFPVGAYINEEIQSFSCQEINVKFGDTIYLFSDGFPDQFGGPKGKKYKYKQLKEKLFIAKNLPINEQKNYLEKEFKSWKGNIEQTDDVLIIGIQIS